VADLFQSEYDEIKRRRGAQDLNDLIDLIERDGSVAVVDDPTEDDIRKARDQQAKEAERQQKEAEKEAEKERAEAEKQAAADAEAAETARVAAMPHPDDQVSEALAPEKNITGEQVGEVEAGKAVGEGEVKSEESKKADQKKATGR